MSKQVFWSAALANEPVEDLDDIFAAAAERINHGEGAELPTADR
jgi:hypothetical protein